MCQPLDGAPGPTGFAPTTCSPGGSSLCSSFGASASIAATTLLAAASAARADERAASADTTLPRVAATACLACSSVAGLAAPDAKDVASTAMGAANINPRATTRLTDSAFHCCSAGTQLAGSQAWLRRPC